MTDIFEAQPWGIILVDSMAETHQPYPFLHGGAKMLSSHEFARALPAFLAFTSATNWATLSLLPICSSMLMTSVSGAKEETADSLVCMAFLLQIATWAILVPRGCLVGATVGWAPEGSYASRVKLMEALDHAGWAHMHARQLSQYYSPDS